MLRHSSSFIALLAVILVVIATITFAPQQAEGRIVNLPHSQKDIEKEERSKQKAAKKKGVKKEEPAAPINHAETYALLSKSIPDLNDVEDPENIKKFRSQSRSLSPSLTPSASILARKKAFTKHPTTGIPQLTDDQIEVLADQVFDGIVTEIHYHDHLPHKNNKDAQQRVWVDRYYRITVLVTSVLHLRDTPMMTLSHSQYSIDKLEAENVRHGGVRKHAHTVEVGQQVDVMMWEAKHRPDLGVGQMFAGLEIGYVLIPKRPDPEVEYRFFTQGIAHRMDMYRQAYPTAGADLPAFEALIPNGVQIVKDDGSGDDTPIKERRERSKSFKWDL